jgi:hypothetical protein
MAAVRPLVQLTKPRCGQGEPNAGRRRTLYDAHMMTVVRGLLDRIVLVAAILGFGCVPSFIAQYRQRVGGRLDQVLADLSPFEQIARRDFGGSLPALIQHHVASTDATFRNEGGAIRQMVDAAARLRDAMQALDTDLFGQAWWLARHCDPQILQATWSAWQPAFALSIEGLTLALVAGVVAWLVFLVIWHGLARGLRRRPERLREDEPFRRIPPRTRPMRRP